MHPVGLVVHPCPCERNPTKCQPDNTEQQPHDTSDWPVLIIGKDLLNRSRRDQSTDDNHKTQPTGTLDGLCGTPPTLTGRHTGNRNRRSHHRNRFRNTPRGSLEGKQLPPKYCSRQFIAIGIFQFTERTWIETLHRFGDKYNLTTATCATHFEMRS